MSGKEREGKVEQMNGKRNRRDEPPLIPIFRFHFSPPREPSFPRITLIYMYLYYIYFSALAAFVNSTFRFLSIFYLRREEIHSL